MTETGFANTATEAARAFRGIMQATARPGHPVALDASLEAPAPLSAAAAAVALTLCDFQTPVWLSPRLQVDAVARYLKFHAGAPLTPQLDQARFAFIARGDEVPPLSLFAQGTHEYPDRSATLVIEAEGFHTQSVLLTGPGIKPSCDFGVTGLGDDFWVAMAENHARLPIGVDAIFVSVRTVVGLPRSTAVKLKETV